MAFLAIRAVPRATQGDQPNNLVGDVICALPDDWMTPSARWRVAHSVGLLGTKTGFWPGDLSQAEVDDRLARMRIKCEARWKYKQAADRMGLDTSLVDAHESCSWSAESVIVTPDFGRESATLFRWVQIPGLAGDDLDSLTLDHPSHRRRFGFKAGVGRALAHASEAPPVLALADLDDALEDRTNEMRPVIGESRRQWAQTRRAEKANEVAQNG